MKILAAGICYTLLSFFCSSCATTANVGSSEDEERPAASYCEHSPWCNLVAVEMAWPDIKDRPDTVPVNNGIFVYQFPRQFDKVSVLGTPPMVVARYPNYRIAVATEKMYDYGALVLEKAGASGPKHDKSPALRYFEIMFTKTLTDPEPENRHDRILWRAAFAGKSIQKFSSTPNAEIYRHDPWTVYMANVDGITHTRETIAVHRDQSDFYLRVFDTNAPKATLLNLIAATALDR